jgi:hypothetical protein
LGLKLLTGVTATVHVIAAFWRNPCRRSPSQSQFDHLIVGVRGWDLNDGVYRHKLLVEAAGVEPASENARNETTTCVA